MRKYKINDGPRNQAIRLGCERGLYEFLTDYAKDMGMSRSSALRRLALIGAHCEAEHGKAVMPTSYENLITSTTTSNKMIEDDFDWGEE